MTKLPETQKKKIETLIFSLKILTFDMILLPGKLLRLCARKNFQKRARKKKKKHWAAKAGDFIKEMKIKTTLIFNGYFWLLIKLFCIYIHKNHKTISYKETSLLLFL